MADTKNQRRRLSERAAKAYLASTAMRVAVVDAARKAFHVKAAEAGDAFQRVLSVTSEQDALDEANRAYQEANQAANVALDEAEKKALLEERQVNEKIESILREALLALQSEAS